MSDDEVFSDDTREKVWGRLKKAFFLEAIKVTESGELSFAKTTRPAICPPLEDD